jgi:hypothetical protein
MKIAPALLVLLLGCGAAEPRPAPDAASVDYLLGELRQGGRDRRSLIASMIRDLGPDAVPTLRQILTRRELPPDPGTDDWIRALDAERWFPSYEALIRQGPRAEAELWDALFRVDSRMVALRCVELLTLIEDARHPPGTIVDILIEWGALPAFAAPLPTARLEPESVDFRERRFERLRDNATPREVLKELNELDSPFVSVVEEVQREP